MIKPLIVLFALASFAAGTELEIDYMSYSFSGRAILGKGDASQAYKRGVPSRGYRQRGWLNGTVVNPEGHRSGTVVCNMGISPYISSPTYTAVYSKAWGGNRANVFDPYQTWTCFKPGYRAIVNRYGFTSVTVVEFNGYGYVPQDTMEFGSYGRW